VVVEIDAFCLPAGAVPPEDQPPLIIDTGRVEARQIAAELLEVIAWRHPQILIGSRIVDHLEPAKEPASEIGRNMPRLPILDEEGAQPQEKPVIVMNYPKAIKALYMRPSDDGRTVAAMDVPAPGIGEIIGGSQREERVEALGPQYGQARHRRPCNCHNRIICSRL
jgi:hypothetical protein